MRRRRRWWRIAVAAGVIYVVAYLALSRRGYAEADRNQFAGFYYFTPENSNRWRTLNYGCASFFAPLNAVDRWLGTGRDPASEPLWGLSVRRTVNSQPA
jgi:hypothetical protein